MVLGLSTSHCFSTAMSPTLSAILLRVLQSFAQLSTLSYIDSYNSNVIVIMSAIVMIVVIMIIIMM
jgi:hypothetical protein